MADQVAPVRPLYVCMYNVYEVQSREQLPRVGLSLTCVYADIHTQVLYIRLPTAVISDNTHTHTHSCPDFKGGPISHLKTTDSESHTHLHYVYMYTHTICTCIHTRTL